MMMTNSWHQITQPCHATWVLAIAGKKRRVLCKPLDRDWWSLVGDEANSCLLKSADVIVRYVSVSCR